MMRRKLGVVKRLRRAGVLLVCAACGVLFGAWHVFGQELQDEVARPASSTPGALESHASTNSEQPPLNAAKLRALIAQQYLFSGELDAVSMTDWHAISGVIQSLLPVGAESVWIRSTSDGRFDFLENGMPIPPDRIAATKDKITVRDASGAAKFSLPLTARGEVIVPFGCTALMLAPMAEDEPLPSAIGITFAAVDRALATQLRLNTDEALLVAGLARGLPGESAGLRLFDIVTQIAGKPPATVARLYDMLRQSLPGTTIEFGVVRQGTQLTIPIVCAANPVAMPANTTDSREGGAAHRLAGTEAVIPWDTTKRREDGAFGLATELHKDAERIALELSEQLVRELMGGGLKERVTPLAISATAGEEALGQRLAAIEDKLARLEGLCGRIADQLEAQIESEKH